MTIADRRIDVQAVAVHRGGIEVVERWADQWRDLCNESVNDQPFFRPEWIAAHIRAFTPQARIVLLTVTCERKLLFVLPLLEEWKRLGGVPLRTLRTPVNSHSCRFDAVRHASPEGDSAVVAAWNHLQNLRGWDLIELEDVLEGGTTSALLAAASNSGARTAQVPVRRNPYVLLPSNSADLQKLPVNKKLRSQLRGIRKELAEKGQLKLERISNADPDIIERFYRLESAGWKGSEGSAIACSPQTRQFYDEVAKSAERFGYLCIYALELNGQLLASHLGLSHKGRYFSPKVTYDENCKQWAPGHLIIEQIIQDCVARNVYEYDITGPNDDWKSKWTSETRQQSVHFIFRRGIPGDLAYSIRFRLRPFVKKLVRKSKPEQ